MDQKIVTIFQTLNDYQILLGGVAPCSEMRSSRCERTPDDRPEGPPAQPAFFAKAEPWRLAMKVLAVSTATAASRQ
jgi:hypothetical protein